MKNLKCLVLRISFTLLIVSSITPNAFAIATKHHIKLGIDGAFSAFSIAEKEFRKGQKFQDKKDFGNALMCYSKSLELWPADETYFKLTFCLYSAKFYSTAGKMILVGLESTKQKGDFKNHFCLLLLLAEIYSETGNFNKALSIYEYLAEIPMDKESSYFIERRIRRTLFEIVNP